VKTPKRARQNFDRRGGRIANADSTVVTLRQRAHQLNRVVRPLEDGCCFELEHAPRFGKTHASRVANEQLETELALEVADLSA